MLCPKDDRLTTPAEVRARIPIIASTSGKVPWDTPMITTHNHGTVVGMNQSPRYATKLSAVNPTMSPL